MLPPDQEMIRAFRTDVASFCQTEMPEALRQRVALGEELSRQDYTDWQGKLRARGWFGGHWPVEFGGLGWSKLQQWTFEDELARQGAPWLIPFGVTYVGPVIYSFGSPAQRAEHLQPILDSTVWWAQGFSEPEAGSDLANLKTTAVRDGDSFVLNGQKCWTTLAHFADKAFVLARTERDVRPQEAISFLLVDLASPGVTLRPTATIDQCHHLNEMFFDDVHVPTSNLVGETGMGWRYAKYLLAQERPLVAEVGKSRRLMQAAWELAAQTGADIALADDPAWRRAAHLLEVEIAGLEALCLELLGEAEAGSEPGAEASLLKIVGSEIMQSIQSLLLDLMTRHGLSYHVPTLLGEAPDPVIARGTGYLREYLHGRAISIYGGSNEIQRNIIAKAVLGL